MNRVVICAAVAAVLAGGIAFGALHTSTIHYDAAHIAVAASPSQKSATAATHTASTTDTSTLSAPTAPIEVAEEQSQAESSIEMATLPDSKVFTVPFYSQFADITPAAWRKIGCGVASLAMLIDFYKPAVAVDTLLDEGIASNAYLNNAGWTHQGLINLSKKYGLDGSTQSYADLSMEGAFAKLEAALEEGPVMASVHYTFEPTNPIPHLVVINGVEDGMVYYNDPAEKNGGGSITISKFQNSWKKRFIEIRPVT